MISGSSRGKLKNKIPVLLYFGDFALRLVNKALFMLRLLSGVEECLAGTKIRLCHKTHFCILNNMAQEMELHSEVATTVRPTQTPVEANKL